MAGDRHGGSKPDSTEAVDVRDVVRELSSLLDLGGGETDALAAEVVVGDSTTDENPVTPDATIAMEAITGPSGPQAADSGAISGPNSGPARLDPTMALEAIHLGEHENTGENEMEEQATEAQPPIAEASSVGFLARLDEPTRRALFAVGVPKHFKARTRLAQKDTPANALFVVLEGRVAAMDEGVAVDVVGPGDAIGATMASTAKYCANFDAYSDVRVLRVDVEAVKTWAGNNHAALDWLEGLVRRRERARVLLTCRPLAKIPRDVLAAQADECTERPVGEGSTLFAEGTQTGSAYVVIDGRFKLTRVGPDGVPASAAPAMGDVMGLASALHGHARGATAVAMTDAKVLDVPPGALRAIAEKTRKKTPEPAAAPVSDGPATDENAPTISPSTPARAIPAAPSNAMASRPAPVNVPPVQPLAEPSPYPPSAPVAAPVSLGQWRAIAFSGRAGRAAAAMTFGVIAGVLSVVPAAVAKVAIDQVIVDGERDMLSSVLIAVATAIVAMLVARFAAGALAASVRAQGTAGLHAAVVRYALSSRISGDRRVSEAPGLVDVLGRHFAAILDPGAQAVGRLGAACAAIGLLEPKFLGLAVAVVGLAGILAALGALRLGTRAADDGREAIEGAIERRAMFDGRDVFRATGRAAGLARMRVAATTGSARALVRTLAGGAGWLGVAAFFWFGGRLALDGAVGLGTVVASGVLLAMAIGPVVRLAELAGSHQEAKRSAELLSELLASDASAASRTTDQSSLRGLVRLSEVRVAAERAGGPSIEVSQLLIRAGEHVALVGRIGAGHDAVARVVAGATKAAAGEVLLDDQPIDALDAGALAQRMGYVSREARLARSTVLENITLTPTPDIGRARAVATAVGLDAMVGALPQAYETPIGPGRKDLGPYGARRIALARALYLDPPVLVIEGALDDLDATTRATIGEAIRVIRRGRTTVIATVHPDVSMRADRIVLLAAGRVSGSGGPAEMAGQLDALRT